MTRPRIIPETDCPNSRDHFPAACNQCEKFGADNCICALWDKALVILLEQEETLLGDIVERTSDLVRVAQQQATEMMDILSRET